MQLHLNRDYDAFLDDLEEDKTYRQNINIYVGKFNTDTSYKSPNYQNGRQSRKENYLPLISTDVL